MAFNLIKEVESCISEGGGQKEKTAKPLGGADEEVELKSGLAKILRAVEGQGEDDFAEAFAELRALSSFKPKDLALALAPLLESDGVRTKEFLSKVGYNLNQVLMAHHVYHELFYLSYVLGSIHYGPRFRINHTSFSKGPVLAESNGALRCKSGVESWEYLHSLHPGILDNGLQSAYSMAFHDGCQQLTSWPGYEHLLDSDLTGYIRADGTK